MIIPSSLPSFRGENSLGEEGGGVVACGWRVGLQISTLSLSSQVYRWMKVNNSKLILTAKRLRN